MPNDVHLVFILVVWRCSDTEECQRTRTRDVELFSVISRLNQNHVRVIVVRYAENRCLDARKVARRSNDQRVLRATLQLGVTRLLTRAAIIRQKW